MSQREEMGGRKEVNEDRAMGEEEEEEEDSFGISLKRVKLTTELYERALLL